jgi:replicative DNA helicase
MSSREPPANLEAEIGVLGGIMIDNEQLEAIRDVLQPEDFYKEFHRKIYRAILAVADRNDPIDLVHVTEIMRRRGDLRDEQDALVLVGIADEAPTAAYTESYARVVKEKSILRNLIHAAGGIMQKAFDQAEELEELLDSCQQEIYRVANTHTGQTYHDMHTITAEVLAYLDAMKSGGLSGLPTGFPDLDRLLSGLQPGSLNLLAARPSMGKTAWALSVAEYVALELKKGVLLYSLEMSRVQLALRLLSMRGKIDMQRIRNGQLGANDLNKATRVLEELAGSSIIIDDSSELSIMECRSRCRRIASRTPLSLIVVDYLQLMNASGTRISNREQEIGAISRGLKGIARELEVPVLALAQLSRDVEKRTNKRPVLSDLRESGSLEQDSDVVMFIYRDDYYAAKEHRESKHPNVAEIIVGKQRNGPTGTVELVYLDAHTRFRSMASAVGV